MICFFFCKYANWTDAPSKVASMCPNLILRVEMQVIKRGKKVDFGSEEQWEPILSSLVQYNWFLRPSGVLNSLWCHALGPTASQIHQLPKCASKVLFYIFSSCLMLQPILRSVDIPVIVQVRFIKFYQIHIKSSSRLACHCCSCFWTFNDSFDKVCERLSK